MAILAIKGHATRGEEVMEMLKMLGGRNPHNYSAVCGSLCFYIGKENNIIYYDWVDCCEDEDILVFTLEEFLEKYPYKVGDKVYNIVHNETQTITDSAWDFQEDEVGYQTNNNEYVYVNYLQPCKEETMENKLGQITLDIPDGYEFFGINDDNKVVLTKIQPKYPKTYKECCEIVNANPYIILTYDSSVGHRYSYDVDNLQHYENIRKLLICRDAYWKIAGEQMGLGKPWEYDMSKDEFSYAISYQYGDIQKSEVRYKNHFLSFPTKEMRDAFYENFKELIETCKEFL